MINILIPLAGKGTRFKESGYKNPKPLINFLGKPMIQHVIENMQYVDAHFIFVIQEEHDYEGKLSNIIKQNCNSFNIISLDEYTSGSAVTCLKAEHYINSETPLIITNCDQIIEDFNFNDFLCYAKYKKSDGILGTFDCINEKNSFIKCDKDFNVTETKEKEIISDMATNGFHYWRNGYMFVSSAKKMIANEDMYNGEYYVAPSYNYLIETGHKIHRYHFNLHFPIGIPEDLEHYIDFRNKVFDDGCS